MKLLSMFLTLAALAVLSGCDSGTPGLLSLEPVAAAKDNIIDPSLLGAWEEQEDKNMVAIVRPGEQSGYQIAVMAAPSIVGFQAKLIRVEDVEYLDLAPSDDNDFRIPGHAIMRIWLSGNQLRWAFLDSDWMKQQANSLATHKSDSKMLVFSPTEAVRAFLVANGADEKAYTQQVTWQRIQ